jgi:hypothetical protein
LSEFAPPIGGERFVARRTCWELGYFFCGRRCETEVLRLSYGVCSALSAFATLDSLAVAPVREGPTAAPDSDQRREGEGMNHEKTVHDLRRTPG